MAAAIMGGQGWRKRRGGGFRPAASAMTPVVAAVGDRRGFAERRLLTHWRDIVGAETAAACDPVRVSYRGKGPGLAATLVVAARPGRAAEVSASGPRIVERVNAAYGYRAVGALRVTQVGPADGYAPPPEPAPGFAEAAAPYAAPPLEPRPSPAICAVEDEELRATLARLERNIRAAAARKTHRWRTP